MSFHRRMLFPKSVISKSCSEETVMLCATISFFTLKIIIVWGFSFFFFFGGLPSFKDLSFSSGHFVVCYNESICSSPMSLTLLLVSSLPVSFSWLEVDHNIFWPFYYCARPHTLHIYKPRVCEILYYSLQILRKHLFTLNALPLLFEHLVK